MYVNVVNVYVQEGAVNRDYARSGVAERNYAKNVIVLGRKAILPNIIWHGLAGEGHSPDGNVPRSLDGLEKVYAKGRFTVARLAGRVGRKAEAIEAYVP